MGDPKNKIEGPVWSTPPCTLIVLLYEDSQKKKICSWGREEEVFFGPVPHPKMLGVKFGLPGIYQLQSTGMRVTKLAGLLVGHLARTGSRRVGFPWPISRKTRSFMIYRNGAEDPPNLICGVYPHFFTGVAQGLMSFPGLGRNGGTEHKRNVPYTEKLEMPR